MVSCLPPCEDHSILIVCLIFNVIYFGVLLEDSLPYTEGTEPIPFLFWVTGTQEYRYGFNFSDDLLTAGMNITLVLDMFQRLVYSKQTAEGEVIYHAEEGIIEEPAVSSPYRDYLPCFVPTNADGVFIPKSLRDIHPSYLHHLSSGTFRLKGKKYAPIQSTFFGGEMFVNDYGMLDTRQRGDLRVDRMGCPLYLLGRRIQHDEDYFARHEDFFLAKDLLPRNPYMVNFYTDSPFLSLYIDGRPCHFDIKPIPLAGVFPEEWELTSDFSQAQLNYDICIVPEAADGECFVKGEELCFRRKVSFVKLPVFDVYGGIIEGEWQWGGYTYYEAVPYSEYLEPLRGQGETFVYLFKKLVHSIDHNDEYRVGDVGVTDYVRLKLVEESGFPAMYNEEKVCRMCEYAPSRGVFYKMDTDGLRYPILATPDTSEGYGIPTALRHQAYDEARRVCEDVIEHPLRKLIRRSTELMIQLNNDCWQQCGKIEGIAPPKLPLPKQLPPRVLEVPARPQIQGRTMMSSFSSTLPFNIEPCDVDFALTARQAPRPYFVHKSSEENTYFQAMNGYLRTPLEDGVFHFAQQFLTQVTGHLRDYKDKHTFVEEPAIPAREQFTFTVDNTDGEFIIPTGGLSSSGSQCLFDWDIWVDYNYVGRYTGNSGLRTQGIRLDLKPETYISAQSVLASPRYLRLDRTQEGQDIAIDVKSDGRWEVLPFWVILQDDGRLVSRGLGVFNDLQVTGLQDINTGNQTLLVSRREGGNEIIYRLLQGFIFYPSRKLQGCAVELVLLDFCHPWLNLHPLGLNQSLVEVQYTCAPPFFSVGSSTVHVHVDSSLTAAAQCILNETLVEAMSQSPVEPLLQGFAGMQETSGFTGLSGGVMRTSGHLTECPEGECLQCLSWGDEFGEWGEELGEWGSPICRCVPCEESPPCPEGECFRCLNWGDEFGEWGEVLGEWGEPICKCVPCDTPDPCPGVQCCRGKPCPPGFRCVHGICEPVITSKPCCDHSPCPPGYRCVNGECELAPLPCNDYFTLTASSVRRGKRQDLFEEVDLACPEYVPGSTSRIIIRPHYRGRFHYGWLRAFGFHPTSFEEWNTQKNKDKMQEVFTSVTPHMFCDSESDAGNYCMRYLFFGCRNLRLRTSFTFTEDWNEVTRAGNEFMLRAFQGCEALDRFAMDYLEPQGFIEVGDDFKAYKCYDCRELQSIGLVNTSPPNLTKVGHGFEMFEYFGCEKLLKLPERYTEILQLDSDGIFDFQLCKFSGCSSLRTLPDLYRETTAISVGDNYLGYKFRNCGLTFLPLQYSESLDVSFAGRNCQVGKFEGCSRLAALPNGYVEISPAIADNNFIKWKFKDCTSLVINEDYQIPHVGNNIGRLGVFEETFIGIATPQTTTAERIINGNTPPNVSRRTFGAVFSDYDSLADNWKS